ncbi:MAG TPA: ABC transporter substrate-binding protein [Phycisphaerae bacterium]|nr:ABC transporter substrate-binding protein [Phycisphaerae bacterium]
MVVVVSLPIEIEPIDVRITQSVKACVRVIAAVCALAAAIGSSGCGNDPYPKADAGNKTFYGFLVQSYDFDPVSGIHPVGLEYTGAICEPLFEYHYLKRPLELQPLLAKRVPEFEEITDLGPDHGDPPRIRYRLRFEIFDGVRFQRSVCFDGPQHRVAKTRELTAEDFAFTFQRIADPQCGCPHYESFAHIDGMAEWTESLQRLREQDPEAANLPIHDLYARVGPIRGVKVTGKYSFDLLLRDKYRVLLYWLAFPTAAPVPFEAVEYYDGREGRPAFRDWPIGTGPYMMAAHVRDEFIALDKNPDWRGLTRPDRRFPGTRYPTEGAPGDEAAGLLDPRYVDQPLPFIDRFEYRRDREAVTRFGKFLQGYYDAQGLLQDTFHQAVAGGKITPSLAARGIRLDRQTTLRTLYLAFNMNDDIVGAPTPFADPQREDERDLWTERNRWLRQAMSLAYDAETEIEIFENGLGIKAESPLPPGFFGADPAHTHRFRKPDLELSYARHLMAEAGYPGGIDPKTGRPLRIMLSVPATDAASMELYRLYRRMFGRLGVELEIDAVTYNAFVQKLRRGSYQLIAWAWSADYPDPETFLMLLYGPNGGVGTGGQNKADFKNARYDFLYKKMIGLADDESATWTEKTPEGQDRPVAMTRGQIIREMLDIFEFECPWILQFHPESYTLMHEWYRNLKLNTLIYNAKKYLDVDPELRQQRREEWNRPVMWPAWVFAVIAIALVTPAVRTYLRRTRQ